MACTSAAESLLLDSMLSCDINTVMLSSSNTEGARSMSYPVVFPLNNSLRDRWKDIISETLLHSLERKHIVSCRLSWGSALGQGHRSTAPVLAPHLLHHPITSYSCHASLCFWSCSRSRMDRKAKLSFCGSPLWEVNYLIATPCSTNVHWEHFPTSNNSRTTTSYCSFCFTAVSYLSAAAQPLVTVAHCLFYSSFFLLCYSKAETNIEVSIGKQWPVGTACVWSRGGCTLHGFISDWSPFQFVLYSEIHFSTPFAIESQSVKAEPHSVEVVSGFCFHWNNVSNLQCYSFFHSNWQKSIHIGESNTEVTFETTLK